MDPEQVHDDSITVGKFLGKCEFTKHLISSMFNYRHPSLCQTIAGITFPNPLGLAAGFDKNALLTDILPSVGFGHMEVGSITGEPCSGNPKPRLWRLPQSRGLVVHFGLKNDGCIVIAKRLRHKTFSIPLGVSIAKTNSEKTVPTQAGIDDYIKAYTHLKDIGDYITINISCPNAFGGEPFTEKHKLDRLLKAIRKIPSSKPHFLKMSPDLTHQQLDDIIRLAKKYDLTGFISSNLTKKRNFSTLLDENIPPKGGISGKVMNELSNRQIEYLYHRTKGKKIIIGCGGIFTAEDAYEKIQLGASLLQMITGMIFEGPQVISQINQGLVRLLKKDGFSTISDAVGVRSRNR
jgi:dihydroorotate dehydrogenase